VDHHRGSKLQRPLAPQLIGHAGRNSKRPAGRSTNNNNNNNLENRPRRPQRQKARGPQSNSTSRLLEEYIPGNVLMNSSAKVLKNVRLGEFESLNTKNFSKQHKQTQK